MERPREVKVAILRAADRVRRRMGALLAPHGLSLAQYNALRILRGAGDPLPTLEVGARMIERTPGVTRLLDGLERKGLVRRERSEEDRRTVLCRITPAGVRLLSELDSPVARSDLSAVEDLEDGETETLERLLERVI